MRHFDSILQIFLTTLCLPVMASAEIVISSDSALQCDFAGNGSTALSVRSSQGEFQPTSFAKALRKRNTKRANLLKARKELRSAIAAASSPAERTRLRRRLERMNALIASVQGQIRWIKECRDGTLARPTPTATPTSSPSPTPTHQPGVVARAFMNFESPHVHPLDMTPDGTKLLVVNTANNALEVFSLGGERPALVRSIPVGLDPVSVRARGNTEAWVVNHISDSVSVIDLQLLAVTRTVAVGNEPADIAFAGPDAALAFVSISGGGENKLVRFNAADGSGMLDLPIAGKKPWNLTVSGDGTRVYVGVLHSNNGTTVVRRPAVSDPSGPYGGLNPPPNRGTAFVPAISPLLPTPPTSALIVRRNAANRFVDENGADWTAFTKINPVDHDIAIVDAQALTVTRYVGGGLTTVFAVGVRPGSSELTAIGTEAFNHIRFVDNLTGSFVKHLLASYSENTGLLRVNDLNPHLTYSTAEIAQQADPQRADTALTAKSIGDPRAIAWSSDGTTAYVVGLGSNNVAVLAANGARAAACSQMNVGQGPTGIVNDSVRNRLYVLNRFDASVSSLSPTECRETSRVPFFDPTPRDIWEGRPFLYDTHLSSGLGTASCGSCHTNGRFDYLDWDLGSPKGKMVSVALNCAFPLGCNHHPMKGALLTQDLRGIIGTEPLHWRGDKQAFADFAPAFSGLLGRSKDPTADEMGLFEGFMALTFFGPTANREPNDALRTNLAGGNAVNGETIFRESCNACHELPTGTNNQVILVTLPEAIDGVVKIPHLRNFVERSDVTEGGTPSVQAHGFMSTGQFDADVFLGEVVRPLFVPPEMGEEEAAQRVKDLKAFLLSFPTGTPAGIGSQITITGGIPPTPTLDMLVALNQAHTVTQLPLMARAVVNGREMGFLKSPFLNSFLGDDNRMYETSEILALATTQNIPVTFTLVPAGPAGVRIALDRDFDGVLNSLDTDPLVP